MKRLIEWGLIVEADRVVSGGGKPRVRLRANPGSAYAIGVQIDGDETSFIMADLTGKVVTRDRRPTLQEQGSSGVIEQVATSIRQIVEEAEIPADKTLGVGVACPGASGPGKRYSLSAAQPSGMARGAAESAP